MTRALACFAGALAVVVSSAQAADEPVVGCVRFEGVEAVPKKELADRILTTSRSWKPWKKPTVFDENVLRSDIERIEDFYRERGYYEAHASWQLDWNGAHTRVDVRIRVEEGEPVRVTELAIDLSALEAQPAEERSALVARLPLAEGDVLDVKRYREAKQELLRRLANLGYPRASLRGGAEVLLASYGAAVRWRVVTGPRVRVGAIEIEGLDRVDPKLVRRELTLEPGQLSNRDRQLADERALYDTGLFRSVSVELKPPAGADDGGPEQTWPVEIRLRERRPRSFQVGVGWGTEDMFRAQAHWLHRNFTGHRRRLRLGAKYSSLVIGAAARLSQPRFFLPRLEASLEPSFLRETVPSFKANRASAILAFEHPLGELWRVRARHRFEYVDVTHVDADDPTAEKDTRLSVLGLRLTRNSTDDVLDPRRGTRLSLDVEPSFTALGSQVDFVRFAPEGRAYLPVGPTVIALRALWSSIQPFGGDGFADVPITERLFSGGSNSVRGFPYDKLGTLDADGKPTGGLSLVEANAELRVPIWGRLRGVVFFDTGEISRRAWTVGTDFRYSTGAGLRFATPIGPLRVDWGYILNPPAGIDRWRIHLSVGQAF